MGIVDVRDVARAHILALTKPEAVGKRFLVTSKETISLIDVSKILYEEFSPFGYNPPTMLLPYAAVYAASFVDRKSALTLEKIDRNFTYDTTNTDTILCIKLRPLEETVKDMGHSLIKCGMVDETDDYNKFLNSN